MENLIRKILPSSISESSVSCDFDTDYCGWMSAGLSVQTSPIQTFPVFDRNNMTRFNYAGPKTAAQGI